MKKPELPQQNDRRELLLPRWAVPLIWAVIVLAIQILLPWIIVGLGTRHGWSSLAPAWWNLAGLAAVALGLGLYAWCLAFHFKGYRSAVRISLSPPHLVTAGPYWFSRNPMYVSGLFVWLGWAVFYGSPAVLAALVFLWSVFALRVIPGEERLLEGQFGDAYRAYKRTVPRWLWRF